MAFYFRFVTANSFVPGDHHPAVGDAVRRRELLDRRRDRRAGDPGPVSELFPFRGGEGLDIPNIQEALYGLLLVLLMIFRRRGSSVGAPASSTWEPSCRSSRFRKASAACAPSTTRPLPPTIPRFTSSSGRMERARPRSHNISGFLPCESGTILFRGQPIHKLKPFEVARRGIAAPSRTARFPDMTVLENVMVGIRQKGERPLWALVRGRRVERRMAPRARALGDHSVGGRPDRSGEGPGA